MLHHRHYTVGEANAQLPLVGEVVRSIQEARRRLADDGFDSEFSTLAELTGGAWPGYEHAAASVEIALGFDRLEELDVVQMLEAKNARRRAKGLPEITVEEYRAKIEAERR